MHTALLTSPRRGRVLLWPAALRMDSNWMRSAAAAAIVFVVAGGGWGIYSWVQPQPARVIAQPPHVAAPGGFSSAGAMRTPNTLNGPVLAHPVTAARSRPNRPRRSRIAARPPAGPARPLFSTPFRLPRPRQSRGLNLFDGEIYAFFITSRITMPSSASTTAPQKAGKNPRT